MKVLRFIIFLLFTIFAFNACDKIEGPYKEEVTSFPIDTTDTATSGEEPLVRRVLLEDYTGFKCGNCPDAATKAKDLQALYQEKLIVLSIHAGFFANPSSQGPYTYDFRTQAGNDLDVFFGISAAGNPNGMVNRAGYPSLNHIIAPNSWADSVQQMLARTVEATIKITNTFDTTSKSLNTIIKTTFINSQSSFYKLAVYLAEDSIVNYQKDYTKTPSDIPNFVHRHVLRGAINSTWGDLLNSDAIAANSSISKSYSFTVNTSYKPKQCSVVAILYNSATYEVLQVNEKKIY